MNLPYAATFRAYHTARLAPGLRKLRARIERPGPWGRSQIEALSAARGGARGLRRGALRHDRRRPRRLALLRRGTPQGLGAPQGRRRVARLMREHGLLSPRHVRQGAGISHDGRVTSWTRPTSCGAPDGTRVLTAEEGMCFRLRRRRPRTEPCAWTTAREYVSGHFGNQVRFWGVAASYSRSALGLLRRSPSSKATNGLSREHRRTPSSKG